MYMVWHVDKYKITFKLIISHWTNKILQRMVVSSGLSRPGTIDVRSRYRAAARPLRNTDVRSLLKTFQDTDFQNKWRHNLHLHPGSPHFSQGILRPA